MKNDIQLRARTLDGEWIEGSGVKFAPRGGAFLFTRPGGRWVRVQTATIGRFTGLHDRKGAKIYEGDRLNIREEAGATMWRVCFGIRNTLDGRAAAGFWLELEGHPLERRYFWKPETQDFAFYAMAEVVGNVHDAGGERP